MSQLPISPKDTPPILIGRLQAMLRGLTGDKGDTGDVTPEALAAKQAAEDAAGAAETAQSGAEAGAAYVAGVLPNLLTKSEAAATDGATKLGTPEGTVQDALDGRPTRNALAAADGTTLLGYTPEFGTLGSLKPVLDDIGPLVNFTGVIRQETADAGWSFIDDSGHRPRNFNAPVFGALNISLFLPYKFTAGKVGQLTITNDEEFAKLGVRAGASVGTSNTTILAYKTLGMSVDMAGTQAAGAPRTITGSMFYESRVTAALDVADLSVVVVTHPTCYDTIIPPRLTTRDAGQLYDNRIVSYTASEVRVATYCQFAGYISYNGSIWAASTDCNNVPTCSFNAGTGTLTVNHESLSGASSFVSVDTRDSAVLQAMADSPGATNFLVRFRPLAGGAAITTPSTDMRFFYRSSAMVRRAAPIGLISLSRENCQLRMGDLASSSGNFWINGQMWRT